MHALSGGGVAVVMTADPLAGVTYMIRYNPNCPSPYEVRTGGRAGLVEAHNPKNLVTHGLTLEQAVSNMVLALARQAIARAVYYDGVYYDRQGDQHYHGQAGG